MRPDPISHHCRGFEHPGHQHQRKDPVPANAILDEGPYFVTSVPAEDSLKIVKLTLEELDEFGAEFNTKGARTISWSDPPNATGEERHIVHSLA